MDIMRKQAERFETRFKTQNVTKVDFSKRPFKVWIEDELHEAQTVIIVRDAAGDQHAIAAVLEPAPQIRLGISRHLARRGCLL